VTTAESSLNFSSFKAWNLKSSLVMFETPHGDVLLIVSTKTTMWDYPKKIGDYYVLMKYSG
jgi:hypothetical protein